MIRKIACLAVLAIAAMGVAGSMAQTYPDRPIKLIVPFPQEDRRMRLPGSSVTMWASASIRPW